LGSVIELCGRCGFDIPADEDGCPGCTATAAPAAPRAARQVAGLALPTRSVQALPATRSKRERPVPTVGPADGARSAFGYTTLILLVTLGLAGLGWAARLDRFVRAVPEGTSERLDDLVVIGTWAALVGLAVGMLAMLAWSVRRVRAGLAHRAERRHLVL
jgi:hypothetical protein